jgi:nucleotide-binding universal stress UspA family protein
MQTPRKDAKGVPGRKLRHVLLADDGSEKAGPARVFAVRIAEAAGARLTATCVRDPTESMEAAERKLAKTRAAAEAAGVPCATEILRPVGMTNPGRRIVDAARRHKVDLIVVGARGRGLARKLLGSVSSYVVTYASVSVSVIR